MYLEEYKLIQSKIDQYGNSSQQLKGFTITFILALGTYSLKEISILTPILAIVGVCLILYYEGFNSIYQDKLKNRALRLERASRHNNLEKVGEPLQIGSHLKSANDNIRNTFRHIFTKVYIHRMQNIIHFLSIILMLGILAVNSYRVQQEIPKATDDINTTRILVNIQQLHDLENNKKLRDEILRTNLQINEIQTKIDVEINKIKSIFLAKEKQRDIDIQNNTKQYKILKEDIQKKPNKFCNKKHTQSLNQGRYIYVHINKNP